MLIEVYGDVVCPWCYIGESNLAQALALRPELNVERVWRPFQLQPQMPKEGLPWADFARQKFGGAANAQVAFEQVKLAGHQSGLVLDFDRVVSAPNTVDAHRLILWAGDQGRQWEMVSTLFKAYFSEGRNLNQLDDLLTVTGEVGLEADAVRNFLADSEKTAEVIASQETADESGIHSVPFYVIDGRYTVVGAQPVEVFSRALDMVGRHSIPLQTFKIRN